MENHSEASMKGDNKEWVVAGRYIKIKVFLSLCTGIVAFMFALSVPGRSQLEGNALSYLGVIQDASSPVGFFLGFLFVLVITLLFLSHVFYLLTISIGAPFLLVIGILILYYIIHKEEGTGQKFFKIVISLGVVILVSASILFYLSGLKIEANPDNVTPINATSSYLGFIQSASFSLVLFLGSLFVMAIIILCFYYIRKDIDETIVLPFETNSQDLNGRVISNMIIAELRRIKEIHDSNKREGMKVAKSERLPVPREDSSEVVLSIDLERLGEELGDVSHAMPDVGTFTLSAISIPIAPLVLTINRLRRPKPGIGRIIHGSVQKYGSQVHIEVHIRMISKLNEEENLICEAERNLKNNDISELMKDIAYNITFILYGERDKKEYGERDKKEYRYVFSWTKIPGADDNRLKEFLSKRYNIDWVCNAGFAKSEDDKIINITKDNTTLSLTLTNEESEVILKINNNRTDNFVVKKENSVLNIYEYRNVGGTAGLYRNDAESMLTECGIFHQEMENRANDLKSKIDICQEKCVEKDRSPAILGNRHNWLLDSDDLVNPRDVICTILDEEDANPLSGYIRKNFCHEYDELKKRFGDLDQCKNESARFVEDELKGYLVYSLNSIIKKFPINLEIKKYISQNRDKKLRPETRYLYASKYAAVGHPPNDMGNCFLLNRLLLEDLLCIKLEQGSAEVKTWEDLKNITEAIYFYNRYMNSKERKHLDQAYNYCAKSSQTNNKIFFSMFYNIAIAYFELGKYNEAEEMFQNAAKIRPIASVHSGRGICLRYLLRFREAMNEFENAICHENTLASLTPAEAARLKINRQIASPGCADIEEKHACFDYSSLSTSWDLFGGIYLDLGCYAPDLYNHAITGFYEAIKRDSIFPYAWLWLGIVYYRKSAISYRKAEKASGDPKSFLYHIDKARKDIERALCLVKKAVELGQTHGYKSFSTSPLGLAACLLLSIKICDLWNQEKSGIKHISDNDYLNFYSEVEEDLKNIEKFCVVNEIIKRNDSSCNDKNRKAYKEAYEVLLTTSIDDEYNRACQESLRRRRSEALDHLKKALDTKRISPVQALFDPDLYLFLPDLEDFLKNRSDDEKLIKEIRYILSKEKDKYIQASFEVSTRNKKEAYNLLNGLREDLIKNKKEIEWDKQLKKFNLDPNFGAIQNIAVICSVYPESPSPRSKIKVNIEVVNTCNNTLTDLRIKALIPKKLTYRSDSKSGVLTEKYVAWALPPLCSWQKHNIDLFVFVDDMHNGEHSLLVNANGKVEDRDVSNNDRLTIKVRSPNC